MMVGVSSRTRSKNVPLFSSFSLDCSSSKRKKKDEDVMSFESVSGSKRRRVKSDESGGRYEIDDKNRNFVDEKCGWERENPITIDSEDEQFVDSEADDEGGDVRKEMKVDGRGGSAEFVDKNGKFVDEECGWERDNPITIDSEDDVRKEVKVDGSGGSAEFVDKNEKFVRLDDSDESDEDDESDESEENDTSDEDFRVDEVNEIIDNDDDSGSDSSFADDVDEEEEVEEEEEEEKKKKGWRKYFNVVEELARKVNDEQSGDEEEEEEEEKKKGSRKSFNEVEEVSREVNDEKSGGEVEKEKKVNEIFDSDGGNSNDVDNDEEEVREDEKENEISDSDGISNDVIVDDDDEEKEEVREEEKKGLREPNNVVEEDKEEDLDPLWQECDKYLMEEEELLKEVKDKKIGICKRNNEKKKIKIRDEEKKGLRKPNNVVEEDGEEIREEEKGLKELNNVVEEDVEEIREEEKGLKELNNVVEEDVEEEVEKLWKQCDKYLMEELLKEVKDQKSGICKRSNEKKKIKISPSGYNNEVKHSDYGSATASTAFHPMKGCSSKPNEASEKHKAKGVEMQVENVPGDDDNAAKSKAKQEKMKDSDKQKMAENKLREDYKGKINIQNGVKKESMDNNGLNQWGKSAYFTSKDLSLVKLLAECYSDKKNSMKDDPILLDVNSDNDDDVNPRETRKPPVCVETPLIWSLKKVQTVELTEEEEEERRKNEELEPIWDQMAMYMNESEAESKIGNLGTNEAQENNGSPSSRCEHDIIYDEEIGDFCKLCGKVITESKHKTQLVRDKYPYEGYGKRASSEDSGNASCFDYSQSQFNASDGDLDANFCNKKGTVWDLIPEVKKTLYPHQQEGFEVIWKNLAGSINLKKLKNADPQREGGCIISHAPGTGKTRLTIVFLMAYLKVFPECFPVIIAPTGLLLTWEDEFKKWNVGVPFHNLNNDELSGKEHDDAVNVFNRSNAQNSKVDTRMVKLISWYKEPSILGISYTLFKNLAGTVESEDEGGESENKKMKNQASEKRKEMGNFLRKVPGLLVLDEGHTPRNKRSGIWKVFSAIPTKKRIIISGTPFQNNCLELYNTLSLVKPSFPNMLPHELKKFCQKQQRKKASKELSWEPVYGNNTTENPSDDKIQQLKLLMDPFVHVHKGAILQKKLPGLRNCVLRLKPDGFHKQILESFESAQNTLIFENSQTLVSIHPSLYLECTLSEQEKSAVDKDRLEKLRLNHNAGVKTRFLVEFVSLCAAVNEKVLVFSQFLRPLHLIIDQLKSALKWTEDEEILYMHGKVKDRQSIIHRFNDANSQAKILLASTKACSEGISLVGGSRVVLLDVEWNPSVEKQAISRAYRIGQKKFVYIYHLLTQGTRECDKYCKQIEKHRLSELIFSAETADNNDEPKSCATNIEDTILDKMIRHENLKDMFDDCVIQVEGARI